MDKLTDLAYNSLERYFKVLSTFGYKSYNDVYKLILLLFIEDILYGNMFNLYVDDKDYALLNKILYNLYCSTCFIPYPELNVDTPLNQTINNETSFRITEDDTYRNTESGIIRILD